MPRTSWQLAQPFQRNLANRKLEHFMGRTWLTNCEASRRLPVSKPLATPQHRSTAVQTEFDDVDFLVACHCHVVNVLSLLTCHVDVIRKKSLILIRSRPIFGTRQ